MKLQVLQENLSSALSCLARLVPSKPSLPILSNILLETEGRGKLKLSATNLETSINFSLNAKIEKEGQVAVPAKIFSEFVFNLPPAKIDLEEKDGSLNLSCQDFLASFNTASPAEFPKLLSSLPEKTLNLPLLEFKTAVSRVCFAAASDEGRPVLTGVLFWVEGKKLTLVATDGYRLSLSSFLLKEKPTKDFQVIIPAKSLVEVSYIVSELSKKEKNEENLPFYFLEKENQVVFSYQDVQLATRLIEGEFPSYEKIIPQNFTTRANFLKEEILQAVKISSLFVRESSNIVKLKIEPKDKIIISANSQEVGEGKTTVEAEISGEGLEIAFNYHYLLEVLQNLSSQKLSFEATGELNPGAIRCEEDPEFLHIIMPVRVGS